MEEENVRAQLLQGEIPEQPLQTISEEQVEFEYENVQMEDLLTDTSHYLEFKQIFQRFDQNEARIAEQKDFSMIELQEEVVQKEDPAKDVFLLKSQQDQAGKKGKKQLKLE